MHGIFSGGGLTILSNPVNDAATHKSCAVPMISG